MTEEQWLSMKAYLAEDAAKMPPDEEWIGKNIDGKVEWFTTATYAKHCSDLLGRSVTII